MKPIDKFYDVFPDQSIEIATYFRDIFPFSFIEIRDFLCNLLTQFGIRFCSDQNLFLRSFLSAIFQGIFFLFMKLAFFSAFVWLNSHFFKRSFDEICVFFPRKTNKINFFKWMFFLFAIFWQYKRFFHNLLTKFKLPLRTFDEIYFLLRLIVEMDFSWSLSKFLIFSCKIRDISPWPINSNRYLFHFDEISIFFPLLFIEIRDSLCNLLTKFAIFFSDQVKKTTICFWYF